jgi:hypothetical protein
MSNPRKEAKAKARPAATLPIEMRTVPNVRMARPITFSPKEGCQLRQLPNDTFWGAFLHSERRSDEEDA